MKEINAYLTFDGNCRDAMTFYSKAFGGELKLMRFAEAPGNFPPEAQDRIMHASLTKGPAVLMASDSMPGMPFHQGNNVWIAVSCESSQETDQLFNSLGEKGTVVMPVGETFWAARFGMLTDQFGIHWMFNYDGPKQG